MTHVDRRGAATVAAAGCGPCCAAVTVAVAARPEVRSSARSTCTGDADVLREPDLAGHDCYTDKPVSSRSCGFSQLLREILCRAP
jgi:hypothetical protein